MSRHFQVARKICYVTPDGFIYKNKNEAVLHMSRLADQLQAAKKRLAALVSTQKKLKNSLKHYIREQLIKQSYYISCTQRYVATGSVAIRIAEREIAGLKARLKGENLV